jgi:cbb3-type cytochrome oxidase subunit 3
MSWLLAVMHWLQQYYIVPMMVVFILIVARIYWPGRRKAIERQGRIPLEDDR